MNSFSFMLWENYTGFISARVPNQWVLNLRTSTLALWVRIGEHQEVLDQRAVMNVNILDHPTIGYFLKTAIEHYSSLEIKISVRVKIAKKHTRFETKPLLSETKSLLFITVLVVSFYERRKQHSEKKINIETWAFKTLLRRNGPWSEMAVVQQEPLLQSNIFILLTSKTFSCIFANRH